MANTYCFGQHTEPSTTYWNLVCIMSRLFILKLHVHQSPDKYFMRFLLLSNKVIRYLEKQHLWHYKRYVLNATSLYGNRWLLRRPTFSVRKSHCTGVPFSLYLVISFFSLNRALIVLCKWIIDKLTERHEQRLTSRHFSGKSDREITSA